MLNRKNTRKKKGGHESPDRGLKRILPGMANTAWGEWLPKNAKLGKEREILRYSLAKKMSPGGEEVSG